MKTLEVVDPVILDLDLFLGDGYTLLQSIHSLDDVIVLVDLLLELFESILCQLARDEHTDQRAEQTADHADQRDDNWIGQWNHPSILL